MPDDNRLPTNQSQLDIADKLQAIATAIINKVASAVGVTFDDTNVSYTANNVQTAIEEASTATGTEYSSGVSVKDKIDNLSTFNLVSVTPGTNVTNAFVFVLELANAYIISGGFTLTGNISSNATIMSGISFNGGGTLMYSCPYSSSGIMTFLNGSIISNAGLNSNPNSYYFNGIVLK